MKNLWLSINPRWIEAIFDGRKSVELRRRAPTVDNGAEAVLYSTSPESSVVGRAVVEGIVELPLDELWAEYGENAAVARSEFLEYFSGRDTGTAIELGWVTRLERPIGLDEIRDAGFEPAQGWRYLSGEATDSLLGVGRVLQSR